MLLLDNFWNFDTFLPVSVWLIEHCPMKPGMRDPLVLNVSCLIIFLLRIFFWTCLCFIYFILELTLEKMIFYEFLSVLASFRCFEVSDPILVNDHFLQRLYAYQPQCLFLYYHDFLSQQYCGIHNLFLHCFLGLVSNKKLKKSYRKVVTCG